jgi:hypothetical protein
MQSPFAETRGAVPPEKKSKHDPFILLSAAPPQTAAGKN